jgi:hypothetical protein
MNRYLKAILIFDLAIPALLMGIPAIALCLGLASFDDFADQKKAEFEQHAARARQIEMLRRQLSPVQDKLPELKKVLSARDVEARLDQEISSVLARFSSDEIEPALRDIQPGPFSVPMTLGEGRHLVLRFHSRWEPLTLASLSWENRQPNLFLESLTLHKPQSANEANTPYLESDLSYFVITEN